jgi:hypothetical protein
MVMIHLISSKTVSHLVLRSCPLWMRIDIMAGFQSKEITRENYSFEETACVSSFPIFIGILDLASSITPNKEKRVIVTFYFRWNSLIFLLSDGTH